MTTYVYQTIPQSDGEKPRYYEVKQSMNDAPLSKHPETGEPIRRVTMGGLGILTSKTGDSNGSCGCQSNCCH